MPFRRAIALVGACLAVAPAVAGTCPAPLDGALRLVLVLTPTMNSVSGKLQVFERPSINMPWTRLSEVEPAVVGLAGLGWAHSFIQLKRNGEVQKVEGDRRTPAGFFPIGASFGFSPAKLRDFVLVEDDTVCVEEPESPLYNTITRRSKLDPTVAADFMRRTQLYRVGLFVQFPTNRIARGGSCIFIHVWHSPSKGTAGCIALPEERVRALQKLSERGAVLAVLPETGLDRVPAQCLPDRADVAQRER